MEELERERVSLVAPVFVLALAVISGATYTGYRLQQSYLDQRAADESSGWPQASAAVAGMLIDTYGTPDRVGPGALVWQSRKPLKRVVVREEPAGACLEEVISYQASAQAAERIARFGRGASADPDAGELTARGGSQAEVFLALNLADEVADGRDPGEARVFYDRTLKLAASGKSSAYMSGLLFAPK